LLAAAEWRAERRLLQGVIAVAGLVPVGAGLAGVFVGPAFLGVGDPPLDLSSHLAYLSGLLLAIGLGFWSCVPRIEERTARVRLLTLMVVTGGLCRLASLVLAGAPSAGHLFGLVMELGVTPAVALWQARVARLSR